MPDNDLDPAANTQMFRAFVESEEHERSGATRSRTALYLVVALVAIAVLVGVAWVAL